MSIFLNGKTTLVLIIVVFISTLTATEPRPQLTGTCYGDYFAQQLGPGGERKILRQTFECPECRGPRKQNIGEYKLFLSSAGVHVFSNATNTDFLPLDERCSPESMQIAATTPKRVLVKCHSVAPDYNPQYQTFTLAGEQWLKLFVILNDRGSIYSTEVESVIVQAGQEDYIISVDRNLPHQLIFQRDSARTDSAVVISLNQYCDKVTHMQVAPPFFHAEYEEQEPQVIVDCSKSDIDRKLAIPFDATYYEVDAPNTRDLRNIAGRLVLSDSNRLMFVSNASITIIDQYNVNTLPLIKIFEQNIDNVDLLFGDILLIEMEGEALHLLNLSEFQVSETLDGISAIPDSTGYCRQGHCIAHAVDGNYLMTFAQRPSNEAYLDILLYNLLNGRTARTSPIQKNDFSQICFIQVIEPNTVSTEQSFSTILKPDVVSVHSQPWYVVLSIVLGIVILSLLILGAVIIGLICLHNKHKHSQTIKEQSEELGHSSELVAPKNSNVLFLQMTRHSKTKEDSTSDYSSKESNADSGSIVSSQLPSQSMDSLSVNSSFEPVKQHDERKGHLCVGQH